MPSQNRIGSGFDLITPIYDACVHLVFQNTFDHLQVEALSYLEPSDHCLIIGGGSGKILRQAMDLNIAKKFDYCELSNRMIDKTINRLSTQERDRVHFYPDFKSAENKFDLVVLPFVLDCYPEQMVSEILDDIKKAITPNARVLVIDFNEERIVSNLKPSISQKLLLKLLYIFFRVVAGINAKSLPPIFTLCKKAGMQSVRTWERKGGWIQASLWCIP